MKAFSFRPLLCAAALGFCLSATAQVASNPALNNLSKKDLVARLLQQQQNGIEAMSRGLLQGPVGAMMQSAGQALQQLPPEKREAAARAIEADVKKFVDEGSALLRDRALKLSPSTVGTMLEEKFSEDELRQVITWMESPVSKKFAQVGPELQKALADKLMQENGPALDAKFTALQKNVAKHLGLPAPTPASAPAPSKAKK